MKSTAKFSDLAHIQLTDTFEARPIWEDRDDVEAINQAEFEDIVYRVDLLKRTGTRQNVLIEGTRGTGKSHLLGRIRRYVLRAGDVFVSARVSRAESFWRELAVAYGQSLEKPSGNKETQRKNIVSALLSRIGVSDRERKAALSGQITDKFLKSLAPRWDALLGSDARGAMDRNVAQALVMHHSDEFDHREIANEILAGLTLDDVDRRSLGLSRHDVDPRDVILALDRLVANAGMMTVIGIDQLDGIIANARRMLDEDGRTELNVVATALMDLANDLTGSLVVVSCLIDTWLLIEREAPVSAPDRFLIRNRLQLIANADTGRALIANLLDAELAERNVVSPYPAWPFKREAFATAHHYSARGLIQQVNLQLKRLESAAAPAEILQLEFDEDTIEATPSQTPPRELETKSADPCFTQLDERFAHYRTEARHHDLNQDNVDWVLPDLLGGALRAFAIENDGLGAFTVDTILSSDPEVHARIRYVVDAAREDEVHWSFRAIVHDHFRAQQTRLQKAQTEAGLGPRRGLAVLRDGAFHKGKKTQEIVRQMSEKGARFAAISDDDLRTCEALTYLQKDAPDALEAWLRSRRPASQCPLFAPILDDPELKTAVRHEGIEPASSGSTADARATGVVPLGSASTPIQPSAVFPPAIATGSSAVRIGTSPRNSSSVEIALEDLRRHAVVFAGSGSGKTVLLRRIVEEAALQGVSSIVLDPNNDLAALGMPWPTAPSGWGPGDAERAAEYFDAVETVVWTPRISSGRPLSFAPLAGLADLVGEPDEFNVALDTVIAQLAPRANLSASTSKGKIGRAVLKDGLQHFVRGGGENLAEFLDVLNDLPDHVSDLEQSAKLSREVAQTLKAEMRIDPMFNDAGQAIDPGVLLGPSPGKRARISVISLIGLPTDDLRQPFISQLQLALFKWVKKNPAGDRPLGGLLVMDEAQTIAPADRSTPCRDSTLALASQARKYGLGLLFATQAPKGIHNQIRGNTSTQVFGKLLDSGQVATAKELAERLGGTMSDISKLRAGEFYVGSINVRFQRVDSPMCLSNHPSSPLKESEIVQLASGRDVN
ncbi:MAG: DUF87 domain-containing protein [Devosia sp.]